VNITSAHYKCIPVGQNVTCWNTLGGRRWPSFFKRWDYLTGPPFFNHKKTGNWYFTKGKQCYFWLSVRTNWTVFGWTS